MVSWLTQLLIQSKKIIDLLKKKKRGSSVLSLIYPNDGTDVASTLRQNNSKPLPKVLAKSYDVFTSYIKHVIWVWLAFSLFSLHTVS